MKEPEAAISREREQWPFPTRNLMIGTLRHATKTMTFECDGVSLLICIEEYS